MVSQRRIFSLLTIIIVISFLLAACERPLGGTDSGEGTVDQTTQTEDVNVGGGTDGAVTTTETTTETAVTETGTDTTSTEGSTTEGGETTAETPTDTQAEAGGGAGDSGGATVTTEEGGQEQAATEDSTSEGTTDSSSGGEAATTETTTTTTTTETAAAAIPATHTVAAGENLYRIGLKYGISWVAIANENGLANPNVLTVGQVLKLPGASTPTTPTPTPSPQTETTYVVKAGDNLFRIGLQFGISWVQIAEANGLVNPNLISVGDTLKIPVNTPGPAPEFSHVVKAGETLFLISLQYGVAWPAIAEANNLASPYIIYVGQTLVIPGS